MLTLIKDLGMRFTTVKSKQRRRFGLYRCDCGAEVEVEATSVKMGNSTRCKLCAHKVIGVKKATHGMTNTRIFNIWKDLRQRCNNPKDSSYKNYGGRGIKVCDEWQGSFEAFYTWAIFNGYSDDLTIDRIENDGDYTPYNCRWATRSEQNVNQRLSIRNTSGFVGISSRGDKWLTQVSVNGKQTVVGLYNTPKEAAQARDEYIIDHNLLNKMNFQTNPLWDRALSTNKLEGAAA